MLTTPKIKIDLFKLTELAGFLSLLTLVVLSFGALVNNRILTEKANERRITAAVETCLNANPNDPYCQYEGGNAAYEVELYDLAEKFFQAFLKNPQIKKQGPNKYTEDALRKLGARGEPVLFQK